MPIQVPSIDDRRYQDLLAEALARVPAHTPEWTNLGEADPGRVLLELFAFIAESVAYRATLIPERNRLKFLSLLGRPLHAGAPARGVMRFSTRRTGAVTTLGGGTPAFAGAVAFALDDAVTPLPLECRVMIRAPARLGVEDWNYYNDYYMAQRVRLGGKITPYRPAMVDGEVSLAGTVDNAVYLALLAPPRVPVDDVRAAVADQLLNLGLVPALAGRGARLVPVGQAPSGGADLEVAVPAWPGVSRWRTVASIPDILGRSEPVILPVLLPGESQLGVWPDLEPTDAGVGELPPDLGDPDLDARLITWIRLRPSAVSDLRLAWVGINAVRITQGEAVEDEIVGVGVGEPDLSIRLSRAPVRANSVVIRVGEGNGSKCDWARTDDLYAAPGEGQERAQVYTLDDATGELRFGDGLRGARPRGTIRASYWTSAGVAGNRGAEDVRLNLDGVSGVNPVPTWGGAPPESLAEAEKAAASAIQHQDRLVTLQDFQAAALSVPGVALARVDVVPAWHADAPEQLPGEAPGVVTVMIVPAPTGSGSDANGPPTPDDRALRAVASWLDPRRLVTTEVLVRGPVWVPLNVSLSVEAAEGAGPVEARESARQAVLDHLSTFPRPGNQRGWPRGRAVRAVELEAIAAATPGVAAASVRLSRMDDGGDVAEVPLRGLELPWPAQVRMSSGRAPAPETGSPTSSSTSTLLVPLLADERA